MRDCRNPKCEGSLAELQHRCPLCGTDNPPRFAKFDEWVVDDELSDNPRSVVFKGHSRDEPNQRVAIKVFKPETPLTEDEAAQLTAEAELLAGLKTERIPRMYGLFRREDGVHYQVRELVDSSRLSDVGPVRTVEDAARVIQLLAGTLEAFAELHELDGSMPLITAHDLFIAEEGQPRRAAGWRGLLPAFVARFFPTRSPLLDEPRARVRVNYRSYAFLDPKRDTGGPTMRRLRDLHPDIGGGGVDEQSDLFSIGVIFWEAIAGRELSSLDDVALSQDIPIPDALRDLLGRLLDPARDGRPATAQHALTEIEDLTYEDLDAVAAEIHRRKNPLEDQIKRPWVWLAGAGAVAAVTALVISNALAPDWEAVVRDAEPSVHIVYIDYGNGERHPHCTAFVVRDDGWLATNAHCLWKPVAAQLEANGITPTAKEIRAVVDDPKRFKAMGLKLSTRASGSKEFHPVGKFMQHPRYLISDWDAVADRLEDRNFTAIPENDWDVPDVALIKIDADLTGRGLELTEDMSDVGGGRPCTVLGFPLGVGAGVGDEGSAANFEPGSVSNTRCLRGDECNNHFGVAVKLGPGSSGSPVIDASGEVLGVFFAGFRVDDSDKEFSYAIPAARVAEMVNRLD